jgi:hypothetical protein
VAAGAAGPAARRWLAVWAPEASPWAARPAAAGQLVSRALAPAGAAPQPAIWCDGSANGLACNLQTKCHLCPACGINLLCTTGSSDELTELYVECVP